MIMAIDGTSKDVLGDISNDVEMKSASPLISTGKGKTIFHKHIRLRRNHA